MIYCFFFSQERLCHWQRPIRSCCALMLRVASQPEAFTFTTKVMSSFFCISSSLRKPHVRTLKARLTQALYLWILKVLLLSEYVWSCFCCSCASHQRQPVQLSSRASVWQADRFGVLRWLCGPVRMQPGLLAERIQRHSVPGRARRSCTVECNDADLYRYCD